MKNKTANQATLNRDQQSLPSHHSDGSELVPAEITSDLQSDEILVAGYTQDDEGIIDNYAVEPPMSTATYPTPKQQLRYVFLGAGAIVLVGITLWITFAIS
ncbi:MAG: ssl1498 family light-harvesting-like protein [Gomphosphaeria aponina SAG 52.96 = DSM 107014]|uniref:Ssl1498 family light-harvesting-like protein n=1 Tax=Gomphosphaeria aponina SAG 52.96 = DSM 107014 TaxID=1521640 RepID=A0A941GMP2_9CHRO|nr:ssl1498 family light-harvesting-like protein [Gomphosphaeria aponina SAG 52.96 = DSM 107014]